MALACGCEIRGGMPVSAKMLQEHYKHTFECLLFWELIMRHGVDLSDERLKLSQARIALIEVIDALFPEARGDLSKILH